MNPTRAFGLAIALSVALGAAPARAGDHEFHEIVDRLASAYHQRPMRFMGLLSLATHFYRPEGVGGLELAIFDDINPSLRLDQAEFDRFMQSVAGAEYHPFVRVRSKHHGEQTYIYIHETKSRPEMLLLNVDSSDAVVMKMWLKPEAMEKWMDDPVGAGRSSAHGRVCPTSD
jgi:hypothetical protein